MVLSPTFANPSFNISDAAIELTPNDTSIIFSVCLFDFFSFLEWEDSENCVHIYCVL